MNALKGLFAKDEKPLPSSSPATLLVIQSDNYNWTDIFSGSMLENGQCIEVIQVGWSDILVQADSPGMSSTTPLLVHCKSGKTVKPDFVLVINEVRGVEDDSRNNLFGLMYAGLPSVNSLYSIYCFLERPIVQAELHRIQRRLGEEEFPVIPQSYFSSFRDMMYGSSFPAVLKVGHAHAGYGKLKVANHHDWEDVRSVIAMTPHYCTAEPYLEGDFDIRIQKIGKHYRAYRRVNVSGNWKTQTGTAMVESIPTSTKYKRWADEASNMFGGLDILTVDVIHDQKTGKEYILEVNGTSSGLSPEHAEEDNWHIRDLVLERMNETIVSRSSTNGK